MSIESYGQLRTGGALFTEKAIYISIYNIKFTYRHEAIISKSMADTVLQGNVMVIMTGLVALIILISFHFYIVFCIHSD